MTHSPKTSVPPVAERTSEGRLQLNPYLHVDPGRIYDPFRHAELKRDDDDFALLAGIAAGETAIESVPAIQRERWLADGWLARAGEDLSHRSYLRYVSLEAHTVCNQSCFFCPVSQSKRESHFMPTEQYEEIVAQLAPFRHTVEGVALINYNEPTLDRRFLDQVRCLKEHGLPAAVLTNGSGLTPKRADALVEMGGIYYLSVNLSTLDPERYAAERGADQLEIVLKNVDAMKEKPIAEEMVIIVLGTGDDVHRQDTEAIRARYADSRFTVSPHVVMDRAGLLPIGLKPKSPHTKLRGCENLGSRPIQHLHITPHAKVVLCCEDYHEQHVVGDLNDMTIAEVLEGEGLAKYRRWIYGVDEAPDDFMCRHCIFARKG